MGYANYIGRVGGLAVALGVGMAVAAAPAVAWADTSDAGSTTKGDSSSSTPRASAKAARSSQSAGPRTNHRSDRGASGAGRSHRDSALTHLPDGPNTHTPVQGSTGPDYTPPIVDIAESERVDGAENDSTPAPVAAVSDPAAARAAASVSVAPPVAAATSASASAVHPKLIKAIIRSLLGQSPLIGSGQLDVLMGALDAIRRALGRNSSAPAATVTSSAITSPNLLFNPGAEIGSPSQSGFTSATIPGWTTIGNPTIVGYDTARTIWSVGTSFAMPDLPQFIGFPSTKVGPNVNGTPTGGDNFFGGGPLADTSISQVVDLLPASVEIDAGTCSYNLSAWLGGYTLDPSAASVTVNFLDGNGNSLGSDSLRKVGLIDRAFLTKFKERTSTGLVPVGTRSAEVVVSFDDKNPIKYGLNARYNDAFADNISFTVDAAMPDPAAVPPVSTVGSLDHVFMVYMENKGYNDIVGSPDAPYLNSLIEQYGFADNYYGLTHGSLPNYYPIVAGSNYGITYNCASPCIDTTTLLTANLDDAYGANGWRGYAQSLEPGQDPLVDGGDYSNDQLPFPAFTAIASDQAYAEAHILPLEQMAIDLQDNATTPAFAWWAANEDFNGEGPVSGVSGMLKFVLNQLNPKHPYNIPALDQFLSDTVPTILDSDVWNDPTVASAIVVTFDEDNNNTYLGFSKEANHIVTVVIPSPGAVAAGMRDGSFTSTQQYDHYSLLRTIEEALGLPNSYNYLTENDEWAVPMNDFWVSP